jgi:amino acid transporter
MIAEESSDTAIVRRLGYEQTLFRGINAFTNFAFGFTGVGVLVSISSLYGYGLSTGGLLNFRFLFEFSFRNNVVNFSLLHPGPVVMLWGFVITFAMTMLAAHSLAEICSAFPSAGSVYHWSGQVVSAEHAPLWSYVCGWFNFLGNTAGDAAFAYTFALFLNAAILISGKESYSDADTAGVAVGVLLCWTILNIFRIDKVGWVNDVAAFIQTATIIILVIVLFSVPSKLNTSSVVFTKYNNETGFDSPSYVVVIGILLAVYSFCGYEASAHMAEETHGSAVSAPKGIINTCAASGFGGLLYLLALLFATTDFDAVINGKTSVAAVDVFLVACGSQWATAAAWLLVVNMFFAGVSSVAVSGRITFALTRDQALPYSSFFSELHPTLQSPINGIFLIFGIGKISFLISNSMHFHYKCIFFHSLFVVCDVSRFSDFITGI